MTLSDEEKKLKKNERQREYAKKTNYAASNKYRKENTKSITIVFAHNTEMDLLEWVKSQENKASYIKQLIREDIERNNV